MVLEQPYYVYLEDIQNYLCIIALNPLYFIINNTFTLSKSMTKLP